MNLQSPILLRRLVYGAILGILVYALFALLTDATVLFHHLRSVPWFVVAVACLLSLTNYALRFFRWHAYLRLLGLDVPVGRSLVIFLAGLLMAISPGKVGEVIKSALLKRSDDLPIARTAPIVFAERLTDLFGLFILAAVGVVFFQYGVVAFIISAAAVLSVLLFLQFPSAVHRVLDIIEGLPLVGAHRPSLDRAYKATQTLLQWRPLAMATGLGTLGWAMEALAFMWILVHLGASAPVVLEAFFVFSVSTLAGALSFLPGGLGVTEAGMTGLLLWLEIFDDLGPSLAATYLIRFTTLWFGVVVGLLSFLLYEWLQRRANDDMDTGGRGGDSTAQTDLS